MRKKLVLFCFSLLALGCLLIAPAPMGASCPPSCPTPYCSNIDAYCWAECGCPGNNACSDCYWACTTEMEQGCESVCQQCGICCP